MRSILETRPQGAQSEARECVAFSKRARRARSVANSRVRPPLPTMIELSTERLVLRPFCLDDVDALHGLWATREVRRYLFDGAVPARDRVVEMVESSVEGFAELGYGFFSLRLRQATTRIVGFSGFRPFDEAGVVEMLFAVEPSYWGRGYATEASREVLRYGFAQCDLRRVVATTDTPNQRSVRVLQRLGLFFEMRRERHGLDTVYYAMTGDEFRASDLMCPRTERMAE